jgi:hypothetical protein
MVEIPKTNVGSPLRGAGGDFVLRAMEKEMKSSVSIALLTTRPPMPKKVAAKTLTQHDKPRPKMTYGDTIF